MGSPYTRFAVSGVAVAILVAMLAWWLGANWYIAWVTGASVATFALYGFDKQQARSNGGRVPELVLHGMALGGGFPGGWAGRAVFRHKTLHTSFTIVLVAATILNAAFALWLFTR